MNRNKTYLRQSRNHLGQFGPVIVKHEDPHPANEAAAYGPQGPVSKDIRMSARCRLQNTAKKVTKDDADKKTQEASSGPVQSTSITLWHLLCTMPKEITHGGHVFKRETFGSGHHQAAIDFNCGHYSKTHGWMHILVKQVSGSNATIMVGSQKSVSLKFYMEHIEASPYDILFDAIEKAIKVLESGIDDVMQSLASVQEPDIQPVASVSGEIDFSSAFYRNCRRNRRKGARICDSCPFRKQIEDAERERTGGGPAVVGEDLV